MKQIILLSIVIMGLGPLGIVHAAPLSFVDHADVAVMTSYDPDASSTPVQLVRWDDRCFCCRNTHRGVTRCKWRTRWRCRVLGGWCAE
jgi:hypothetical protein